MTLGAQLYSLRDFIKTPDDTAETLRKVKAMGYENVQWSHGGDVSAEYLRDLTQDLGLPIACTHDDKVRLVEDTEGLIREHEILDCPVLGLGMMPKEYRRTLEGLRAFCKLMEEPVQKIKAAGMRFAYHNHNFEFLKPTDDPTCSKSIYDIMLEELDWNFILDTCWVQFAGQDACEYLHKVGGSRLRDVHFKDMKKEPVLIEGKGPKPDFVPCGQGILDFAAISRICTDLGVEHVFVEQDNCKTFEEMAASQAYLKQYF